MTRKRGSLLTGSISTRSMAPGAARWPEEICAPSKAGPVGDEQASTRVSVAEQDLGVGADVDDQHQLVGELRRFGERDRGGVGADVAGDAGQEVDAGVLVQAELDLLGPEVQRVGGGQREGGHAELDRVDAEHEVVHDRVADDHRLEDQARAVDAGLGRRLAGEVVEGGADGAGHLQRAAGVQHRVAETRLIRSSPKRICGFIRPMEAFTSPVARSQRWPAMVVEPTSMARP